MHVLRTVSGGSFIIPLLQGSNDMNQSIDTGTNIYTINCSNRGGSLKIMKTYTYEPCFEIYIDTMYICLNGT